MSRPVSADSIGPKPTVGTLLRRGFAKHCPRCGAGHLYRGWFKMKDRCPVCGYRFEREPGFFVGAYFINFAVTEGLLFARDDRLHLLEERQQRGRPRPCRSPSAWCSPSWRPVVFYPFSRTIWSAIDLAMTPMELDEIVAAEDVAHVRGDRGRRGVRRTDGLRRTTRRGMTSGPDAVTVRGGIRGTCVRAGWSRRAPCPRAVGQGRWRSRAITVMRSRGGGGDRRPGGEVCLSGVDIDGAAYPVGAVT